MRSFDDLLLSETTDIEFKESLEMSKPKSWLKTVSAFANGIGGCIYRGVNDSRNIIGLSNAQQAIEKISEIIKAKIEPMLLFKINPIEIEGKTVVQLEIKAGASTPYYYVNEGNKTAYVRLGNESVTAPAHILNELIIKGQRLSFDAMASRLKFTDVSFTLFEATFKQRTRTAVEKTSDYFSFGIVRSKNHMKVKILVVIAMKLPGKLLRNVQILPRKMKNVFWNLYQKILWYHKVRYLRSLET